MSQVGSKSDRDEEWGKGNKLADSVREHASKNGVDLIKSRDHQNQTTIAAADVGHELTSSSNPLGHYSISVDKSDAHVGLKGGPNNGEDDKRFHGNANEADHGKCSTKTKVNHLRTGRKESSIPVGIAVAWKRTDNSSATELNSVGDKKEDCGKGKSGEKSSVKSVEGGKGGGKIKKWGRPGLSSPNLPKRPSSHPNSGSYLNLKDSREGLKKFRFSELTQVRPASASCVGGNQVIPGGPMKSPFMDSRFPFPGLNLGDWAACQSMAHLQGMSKGEAYMGYHQHLTPGQEQQLLELQWSQQQHLYRDAASTNFAHGYLYHGILPDALEKYEQYLQQTEMQRQAQTFHLHHSLLQQQQYLQQDYDIHRATPIASPSFSIPSPSLVGGGVGNASSMWPPEYFHHNSTTTLSPKSLASSSPSPITVQQQQQQQDSSLLSPASYRQGTTPSPYSSGGGLQRARIPTLSPFSPTGSGREQLRRDGSRGSKGWINLPASAEGKKSQSSEEERMGGESKVGKEVGCVVKKRHDFSRMESLIERREDISVPLLHCQKELTSSAGLVNEENSYKKEESWKSKSWEEEIKCEKRRYCGERNGGVFPSPGKDKSGVGGGRKESVKLLGPKMEDYRKWESFKSSEKSETEDILRKRREVENSGRDVKYTPPGWRCVEAKLGGECNGKFPEGRELLMQSVKVERDEMFRDELSYCGQGMLREIKREVGEGELIVEKSIKLDSSEEVFGDGGVKAAVVKVDNVKGGQSPPPYKSILMGGDGDTKELTDCDKDIKCPAFKLASPDASNSAKSAKHNSDNNVNSFMYGGVVSRNGGDGRGHAGLLDLANAVDSANLRVSSLLDCPSSVLGGEDGKYKRNGVEESDGNFAASLPLRPIEEQNDRLNLLATVAQEFGNEILKKSDGVESGVRRNSSSSSSVSSSEINLPDSPLFSNNSSSLENSPPTNPSPLINIGYSLPNTLQTFGSLDNASASGLCSDNNNSNVLKKSTPDQANYPLCRTLKRPHGHPPPPVASVAPVVLRIPTILPASHGDKQKGRKKSELSRHGSKAPGSTGENDPSSGKIPVLKIRKKSPSRSLSTEEYTSEEIRRRGGVGNFEILSENVTGKRKSGKKKVVVFSECQDLQEKVLPLKLKKRRSTTDGLVMKKGNTGISVKSSRNLEDNHTGRRMSASPLKKPLCTGEIKMTFSRQCSGSDGNAFTSAFTNTQAYNRQESNNNYTDLSMSQLGEVRKGMEGKSVVGKGKKERSGGNTDRSHHHNQEESCGARADLKIRIVHSKGSASKVASCIDEGGEGGKLRIDNINGSPVYSSCFKSEKYRRRSGAGCESGAGENCNGDGVWLMSPSVGSEGTDWEADPALAVTAIKCEESKTEDWLAEGGRPPTEFLTYEDLTLHTKQKSRRESYGSAKKVKTKGKGRDKSGGKSERHVKPCLKAEPVFRDSSCHEEDEDELPSIDGDESSDARSSTIYLARRSQPLPRRISMHNDRLEDEEEEEEEFDSSSVDHIGSAVTEAIGDVEDNEEKDEEEEEVCFSSVEELVDEMRILTEIQGLFYTGKLNALQPPDVYGVTLDNERGAPPHFIFSAEEVLEKCIREVKPVKLVHGLRICAYWSPQYSGLYAGKVSTDYDPNYDAENDLIPIEFDDGDTGVIKRKEIRLLSKNHPIREYDPNPLLTLEKKQRKRRCSSANTSQGGCNGEHEEPDCGEPYCVKAPKMSEEDAGAGRHMYMSSSRMMYWTWKGLGFKKPKSKKDRNKEFFNGIQRGDEEINVGDSALFISNGNARPFIGRVEKFWEKKGKKVVNVRWFYHPEEVEGSSKKLQGLKYAGALFESPHIDENDVQTIAKKCQVLPFDEFKKQSNNLTKWSKNSSHTGEGYYVAGFYDPYTYKLQLKDLK